MEGLKIHKIQYFPVYAQSDLERIQIDGYTKYIYDQESKLVKYDFDLSKCVRLDLFLQSADLYRIRGGQALWIMKKIISKCDDIQKQKSNHKYLTSDKVWLVLKDGSEQLKFVFSQFLDFDIHFTGYVSGEDSIEFDQKFMCKKVLTDILNNFEKFQRTDNEKKVDGVSISSIKVYLLNQIHNNISMQQLEDIVTGILGKYSFTKQSQKLKGIDFKQYSNNLFNTSHRYSQKDKVIKEISEIQVKFQSENNIKPVNRQQELELMKSQLDFDSFFYSVYANAISKNLEKRPKISENIKEYSNQLLIEISSFFQYSMSEQYQKIVAKLDQALSQDFKFGSLIPKKEVDELILQHIQIQELQICNSIESFNLYKNKKYVFTQQFHLNLKQKIIQTHKDHFIEQIEILINNLV